MRPRFGWLNRWRLIRRARALPLDFLVAAAAVAVAAVAMVAAGAGVTVAAGVAASNFACASIVACWVTPLVSALATGLFAVIAPPLTCLSFVERARVVPSAML